MRVFKPLCMTAAAVMTASVILTGCAGTGGGSTAENGRTEPANTEAAGKPGASGESKIVIYQSKVEITDQLKAAAKQYQDETGVEVEIWETTSDEYISNLKLKFSSGQMPTIFSVRKGTEAEDLSSYLAPLDDMKVMEYVSDETALKVDGKQFGVPYSVEGFGMVADTGLVKKEDMSSYDTMVSMMERFRAEGINPFGLGQDSYFLIGHIMNTPFALMDDPIGFIEKLNQGEVRMADTKEFQAFGEMMVKVRELATSPMGMTYDKEVGDFATGKSAMIHQGNWVWSVLNDYEPGFESTIYPLPLLDNQKIAVSVPYYWAVNSQVSEETQQAGKDFLDWLYTSEEGMEIVTKEFGFVPATSNIGTDDLDPLSKCVADAAAEGNILQWTFDYWPAGIIDADLAPAAQEFFISEMTGQEFIDTLDQAWENALKNKQ